jgi:Holliday junction resolvasome RuvABC endonuclease subunit
VTDRERAILSIDPGETSGIAAVSVGAVPRLLWVGSLQLDKETPSSRVNRIMLKVSESVFAISTAYIEKQYVGTNPHSALIISRRAGRWLEACLAAGLGVEWVSPQTWQSRMLAGLCSGRAKRKERKAACQHLARLRWGRSLSEDEADAAVMGAYAAEVMHGREQGR